jgi:hypothetical protein
MNNQLALRLILAASLLRWVCYATAADAATAATGGIDVVVDASESMCGFFHAQDPKGIMLSLLRKGVVLTDNQVGDHLYLLRQVSKHSVDPARDVMPAPQTILATAQNMSQSGNTMGCQPFAGVDSSMELIFDPKSPTRQADSMILITDAQFDEPDRARFLDGFTGWAQDAQKAGESTYAGFAFTTVPFHGRYFPVSDPDRARRAAGYPLATHERPLFVFWFARSARFLDKIQDFVATLEPDDATAKSNVQHLLPGLQTGNEPFSQPWSAAPPLGRLIEGTPVFVINVYDKSRTESMLRQCLSVAVRDDGIDVTARKACHDGKPFFDSVSWVDVKVKTKSTSLIQTSIESRSSGKDPDVVGRITPTTARTTETFRLHSAFPDDTQTVISINDHSIESDFCPPPHTAAASHVVAVDSACVAKLQGRTFQADILVAQLIERQKRIVANEFDGLNNITYTLKFQSK